MTSELVERNRRTLTDTQRLIWRDDVEGICPSPDMCFEYGEHVRCGPCAIKQSLANGVEPDMSLPNLPEVSRQRREIERLTAQLAEARQAERAAVVAFLRGEIDPEWTEEYDAQLIGNYATAIEAGEHLA